MVELFDGWVQLLGWYGVLVLGAAAAIEYVFPPFPGDTILLLGGIYAVRGDKPWLLVLVAVTVGSVVGAAVDYAFGRLIAARVNKQPEGRLFFGLSHGRIRELQEKMRRRGSIIILLNRFVPAVRSLSFVAAGASGMNARKVMALGAASALLWNGLLMGLGAAVGGNTARLAVWVRQYERALLVLLALLALGVAARFLYLRLFDK